ncbi:MAG: trigger factor [Coriobacteriales bacterium]|jgi:trigger factor|nr:trigger factor [Coriobacteriales bacterium]
MRSALETSSTRAENNRVHLSATIAAVDVDRGIKAAYKEAGKARIPGFRTGKAPRKVLENYYGGRDYFLAKATDTLVNEIFPLAIDAEGYVALGKPDFEEIDLVEEGSDFSFALTFTVRPLVELSSYDPLQIELPAEEATEEEIDEQVQAMLAYYVDFTEVIDRPVQAEDFIYAELETTADGQPIEALTGENVPYSLGSGAMPASFDENFIGLEIGAPAEFDYQYGEGELGFTGVAENIHVKVTIKAIEEKRLPELTDAWVKDTLEFENLADFRARIAETIRQQKEREIPRLRDRLLTEGLAARVQMEGEPPAELIAVNEQDIYRDFFASLQRQGMGFDTFLANANITSEQFREDAHKQALEITLQELALDALARHLGIVVTEEEIVAEFEKSGADDPADLFAQWKSNGRLSEVREQILRSKAAASARESAEVFEPGTKPATKSAAKEPTPKKTAAKKAATTKDSEKKTSGEAPKKKPATKKTAVEESSVKKTEITEKD